VTAAEAVERFSRVSADLATHHATISVGVAELDEDDILENLIARADEAMYRERDQGPAGT
jgi:PleD family two-component response regulator